MTRLGSRNTTRSWLTRISTFHIRKQSVDMRAATSENLIIRPWDFGCNHISSASWGKAGYPSIFTIGNKSSQKTKRHNLIIFLSESTFEESNKYIHSSNESVAHLHPHVHFWPYILIQSYGYIGWGENAKYAVKLTSYFPVSWKIQCQMRQRSAALCSMDHRGTRI